MKKKNNIRLVGSEFQPNLSGPLAESPCSDMLIVPICRNSRGSYAAAFPETIFLSLQFDRQMTFFVPSGGSKGTFGLLLFLIILSS